MSNEKLPDFSDIDWDAALDEWEQRVVVAPGDDPDKGKGKDEGSAAAAAPPKAPKPPPSPAEGPATTAALAAKTK